jgi:hypothetical protein
VRYLDGVFAELFDLVPKNTGSSSRPTTASCSARPGYFGHGPIMHEKCFEVPFLEGKLR